jgi:hypothetical protein
MRERSKTALFLLVVGIFGAIALAFGIWASITAENANDWPTTMGEVTQSYIQTQHGREGTTYSPVVFYTYQVDGFSYTSNRVSMMTVSSSDYSQAANVVERYSVGSMVEVHYDPDQPSSAMLETGMGGMAWIVLLVGGSFAAIGFLGAAWAWRSKSEVGIVRVGRYSPAPTYGYGVTWRACDSLEPFAGEKVLWQGKPVKMAYLLNSDGRQSMVGGILLLFFGLAILIGGLVIGSGIAMVGGIFFACAVGGLSYGLWKQNRDYPDISYLLTEKRVLSRSHRGGACFSIDLENIYQVLLSRTFTDSFYRTGSLVFSDTQGVDISSIRDPEGVRKRMVEAILQARQNEQSVGA